MAIGQWTDYTIVGLAVLFFLFWLGLWLIHFAAIFHASRKFYRTKKFLSDPEVPLPAISILKPITGVDPHLYSNLETFFQMVYPTDKYELLFCVQEATDPAIPLIESLQKKNPGITSKIFVGGENVGLNPKINNLMPGYKAARFDHIMISDAGLRILPEALLDMTSYLSERVVLVHQLPFVCFRQGFAGILEMTYFGSQPAKMALISDMFGINCLTGMSFIIKKEILDDAGGLQTYSNFIGEDYAICNTVVEKGLKFSLSSLPALQNSGFYTVKAYQDRMIRWCRLRIHRLPTLLILEPMHECVLLGMLASWAVTTLFDWNFLVFFLIHLLVWFLLDYFLIKLIQGSHVSASALPSSRKTSMVGYGPSSYGPATGYGPMTNYGFTNSSPPYYGTKLQQSQSAFAHPHYGQQYMQQQPFLQQHLSPVAASFSKLRKDSCGDGASSCDSEVASSECFGVDGDDLLLDSGVEASSASATTGLTSAAALIDFSAAGDSGAFNDQRTDLFQQRHHMLHPFDDSMTSTSTTTKHRPSHSRSSSLTLSSSSSSPVASGGSLKQHQRRTGSGGGALVLQQTHLAASTPLASRLNSGKAKQLRQSTQSQTCFDVASLTLTPSHPFPVSKFDFLIAWIFREFLVPYLFVKALASNKVVWRTGAYRLEWGGTATAAEEGSRIEVA